MFQVPGAQKSIFDNDASFKVCFLFKSRIRTTTFSVLEVFLIMGWRFLERWTTSNKSAGQSNWTAVVGGRKVSCRFAVYFTVWPCLIAAYIPLAFLPPLVGSLDHSPRRILPLHHPLLHLLHHRHTRHFLAPLQWNRAPPVVPPSHG